MGRPKLVRIRDVGAKLFSLQNRRRLSLSSKVVARLTKCYLASPYSRPTTMLCRIAISAGPLKYASHRNWSRIGDFSPQQLTKMKRERLKFDAMLAIRQRRHL